MRWQIAIGDDILRDRKIRFPVWYRFDVDYKPEDLIPQIISMNVLIRNVHPHLERMKMADSSASIGSLRGIDLRVGRYKKTAR